MSGKRRVFPASFEREAVDRVASSGLSAGAVARELGLHETVLEPTARNGLRAFSRLMVDKITTVPKSKVGERIGRLDDEELVRLNQAMMVFHGLAVSPRTGRKGQ